MRWRRPAIYRPPTDRSNHSKKLINRQQLPNYVRNWWEEKVSSGRLYLHPEAMNEGTEYEGDVNWPRRASFLSLYHDFIHSVGKQTDCTHGQFIHYLHKYTPLDAGHMKRLNLRREDGSKLWSVTRSFIEIPRIEGARRDNSGRESADKRGDQGGQSTENTEGAKWYPI